MEGAACDGGPLSHAVIDVEARSVIEAQLVHFRAIGILVP